MTDTAASQSVGAPEGATQPVWLPSIRKALEFLEDSLHDETILACEEALELEPRCPEALHILGLVNFDLDEPATALKLIQAAHQINPEVLEFVEALASLYATLGNVNESLYYAKLATILEPHPYIEGLLPERFGTFFYNLERGRDDLYLGVAERRLRNGEVKGALAACETQLELTPGDDPTLRFLARATLLLGEIERSESALLAVMQHEDATPEDQLLLAETLSAGGRHRAALACHRAAIAREPEDPLIGSRHLASALADPSQTAATMERLHADWYTAHGAAIERRAAPAGRARDPEARLRIGYVGCRFGDALWSALIEPVLQLHDREAVEVFCYADGDHDDATSERMMRHADRWTDIDRIDDETVWEILRGDAVDITVDLSGHGPQCRALALARRPSPITVSWLGYGHPPGLPQIDYFLTDEQAWPASHPDPASGEQLWRLDHGLLTFRLPALIPDVAPPPKQASGTLTFGIQTDLRFIGPEAACLWAEVLRAVPSSRLLISNALNLDQRTLDLCADQFTLFGVRNRIDIVNPRDNFDTQFEFYEFIDVALDTPGVSRIVETCHALWMGVPLISLAGDRHGSRIGASILHAAGFSEWVAENEAAYVEIARRLNADDDALASLRAAQRDTLIEAPFGRPSHFVAGLERAYREMWHRWCRGDGDD